MKTENMKLLDLQTGKYLELGINWGYYGEYIITIRSPFKFHKSEKYSVIESTCDELAFHKAEPPLPLKEICEKVGGVIYGGRYVLMFSEYDRKIGDVVDQGEYEYHRYGYVAICDVNSIYVKLNGILDIPQFQRECAVGRIDSVDYEVIGNFFEEYSKQLRNELNKFDELMEIDELMEELK